MLFAERLRIVLRYMSVLLRRTLFPFTEVRGTILRFRAHGPHRDPLPLRGRVHREGPVAPSSDDPVGPDGAADSVSTGLLRAARAGDPLAVEQICERYLPALRRWARGRLPRYARHDHDTDDLIQEVVLRAILRLRHLDFSNGTALVGYLRQSVGNAIRDEIRKSRIRNGARGEFPDDCPDTSFGPLDEAIGRETLDRYEGALTRLSALDRALVVARVEWEFDYARIAEEFGRPSPAAARMAVSRALVRLAEEMRQDG